MLFKCGGVLDYYCFGFSECGVFWRCFWFNVDKFECVWIDKFYNFDWFIMCLVLDFVVMVGYKGLGVILKYLYLFGGGFWEW